MSATPYSLGRVPHPETPQAAEKYPMTAAPGYQASLRTATYWWEGGAWLDQGPYGTCVGNAFAHRRADSPVPKGGIDEAYARQLYLDASGDTTYQQGTSGLAACRVLADRGTIKSYHWVTSMDELKNTVLELGSICVGTVWYGSMFDPVPEHNNMYVKVDPKSGIAGGHEYLINGINLEPSVGDPFVRMKNSWGRGWGHGGTARILLPDLAALIFTNDGDAVLISEVR